jgi:hypothetical protein
MFYFYFLQKQKCSSMKKSKLSLNKNRPGRNPGPDTGPSGASPGPNIANFFKNSVSPKVTGGPPVVNFFAIWHCSTSARSNVVFSVTDRDISGSGFFYHPAKIVIKILIPTVL